jgi:7-cyano-7-deazaguanine tRNA-ribosyltransferase
MSGIFKLRATDAAGRIGELRVPRSDMTVETPALMPVINPNIQTIAPARLEDEFDAEICITNGYIISQSDELREAALAAGLHELLDFSGAIMTDSGSFQLAEYGDIDATTEEILDLQYRIGADIGTPVDIPTPPDASRERAERDLELTQSRLESTSEIETGEMLVNAPVQGARYPDLRETASRDAYRTGVAVFPIGGVVPLLNAYRYGEMVEVVAAAKRGLGADSPAHLFGAGHPMMFALAVALGCDLFDSAAYALYARDDRYLTVRGTERLATLEYLPCECPVCVEFTPDDLRDLAPDEREKRLAEHNLYVSFGELRRIKQAIRRGNLLELVEARARGHPAMCDGYRALLNHAGHLEKSGPTSKDAFFYLSSESADRPEVLRHHERLSRLSPTGRVLLTEGDRNDEYDETWRVVPPFGPFPRALSETYPLTAEVPQRLDERAYERAAVGITKLVEANTGVEFTLAHRDWPERALNGVPECVTVRPLESMDEYDRNGDPEP